MDETDCAKQLGDAIRRIRKRNGVSQEDLASLAGIDRAYFGSIERGERNVSLVNLVKVAKALNVSLAKLMAEAEKPSKAK